MAIVRENTPKASGKSSIATMLAQQAQPPAMAAAPPRPPLNGMRAPPPPAIAPGVAPPVRGAMPAAVTPTPPPGLMRALLARMYGGQGPGGPVGGT